VTSSWFFLSTLMCVCITNYNATFVVAERSGWWQALGASKSRLSAKEEHTYRKRACLEALRLTTTKLTQQGTGDPSWGQPTQLRISRESAEDWWIQTELARTRTQNATKPNPLEIIPLRPTRKENNWETEEAMERAAVTLETERVKWPSPGCWWWW